MRKHKQRRVAVLAGSSVGFGWREKVMRGIAGYSHDHEPWHVYSAHEGAEDSLFFSRNNRWDGVIARVTSHGLAKRIRALGIPVVGIGSVQVPGFLIPRVQVDEEHLAQLAHRHFLAMGLSRFGYCGYFATKVREDRAEAFVRLVSSAGYACAEYRDFTKLEPGAAWQARERDLIRWLKRLEKPVGILTWDPDVALQVVEACSCSGISIPAEVAILSADEDKAKCELSSPTVSAIEIPAARIGYQAAALLDQLMDGGEKPVDPILIEPSGTITMRESTDVSDLIESQIHRALKFILDHAEEPITIAEIAESITVSQRWLERHFQRMLGHSPREELRRSRLDLAKKLLIETEWGTERVARASGLTSGSYMNYVFQKEIGLTPGRFRRQFHAP